MSWKAGFHSYWHRDNEADIDNLLGHAASAVVAFALHHLSALCCPTLRANSGSDIASIALHSRTCEDLTGANGTGDDASLSVAPELAN
ncbi:hypothetical protein [Streptomyces sp. NPDC007355]|uniref:hypothetical protein n=1 Tax=Streptomyces sp. NPDC007355 TaxID=3364778 RepID=UPI0036AB085D